MLLPRVSSITKHAFSKRYSDNLRGFSKLKSNQTVAALDNKHCINMGILYDKEARVGDQAAFRFGRLGHLSGASVLFQVGNTVVHAAVNSEYPDKDSPSDSFLPLTVDYRFRGYGTLCLPSATLSHPFEHLFYLFIFSHRFNPEFANTP
jgi:hypothetical protein